MPKQAGSPHARLPKGCFWRGDTIWLQCKVRGERFRVSLQTDDAKAAAKRAAEERQRLKDLAWAPPKAAEPETHSWAHACGKWFKEVAPGKVKPKVLERYKVSVRQMEPYFAKAPIESINKASVSAYISARTRDPEIPPKLQKGRVSNATIRRDLTALSMILRSCVRWEWIPFNPMADYERDDIPERRDPIVLPREEDVLKVIEAASPGMAGIIRILDQTGMRAQEAVKLEREDVDPERRAIHLSVTKTNRPRTLSWKTPSCDFEPVLADASAEGFLFTSANGDSYKQFSNNFHDLVARVARREKAAGRRFRPFRAHDLRHLFAVRWMRQGGSVYHLSKHLGHTEVATTEIYLDYLTEDEKAVAKGLVPAVMAA